MRPDTALEHGGIPRATGTTLVQTLRLARWYFFTARRRLMGKVLFIILALGAILAFTLLIAAYEAIASNPPTAQRCFSAAEATQIAAQGNTAPPAGCVSIPPQELAAEQEQWQATVNDQLAAVTFPTAIGRSIGYVSFMGIVLVCILAGALVGTEFAAGTLRLTVSRGVTRGQVLAALVMTIALFATVMVLVCEAIFAAGSLTLGIMASGHADGISAAGLIQLGKYTLGAIFWVLGFGLIALFMAVLGRSTAAGIAVSLGYLVAEIVVGGILRGIGSAIGGHLGNFLTAVPDWFLGTNLSAVASYAGVGPLAFGASLSGVPAGLTFGRALIVSLLYCGLLIGLSYLVLRMRDVTD